MNYRYFIELQYNGRNYHGWQIQPNAPTIQSELNEKLSVLLNQSVNTVGAGRTDTGVHAKYYIAHFESESSIDSKLSWLSKKLNNFLSSDIVINRIFKVPQDAHARFSALSRTYEYYISLKKNVFQGEYLWYIHDQLDIEKMNQGAEELKRHMDFTSFCKLHSNVTTNDCIIEYALWKEEDSLLTFTITADRFLRNMVRSIVGTLVMLGRDKINMVEFQKIIELKNRSAAGESAPAQALFLTNIVYPQQLFE